MHSTGTSARPSAIAAATLPWPAMILPSASTSTGLRNPNAMIDDLICATCRSLCRRALRAAGFNPATGRNSTLSGATGGGPPSITVLI